MSNALTMQRAGAVKVLLLLPSVFELRIGVAMLDAAAGGA